MVIDEKHKIIFIHTYKTGGESIARAMGGGTKKFGKHIWYSKLPTWRDNYFSFAFVRNPWDRVVSSYNYLLKRKKYNGSFEKYIHSQFDGVKTLEQLKVVDGCTFIGRFEHLQKDFDTIRNIVELPTIKLLHVNKSNHQHYSKLYTPELRDKVTEAHIDEIEHFGYVFNGTAVKNIGNMK